MSGLDAAGISIAANEQYGCLAFLSINMLRISNIVMLRFIPSEDVPHYKLTVHVIVPQQFDKRGRSSKKTKQLVAKVKHLVARYLVASLWGEAAHKFEIIVPESSEAEAGGGTVLTIEMSAPVEFDQCLLAQEIKTLWLEALGHDLESYVHCSRHYTTKEFLEHIW